MAAKEVIVAAALMLLAKRSMASCPPCYLEHIKPIFCGPTPTCSYGLTQKPCGCCDVCLKGPGESCGGNRNYVIGCAKGLECQKEICTQDYSCYARKGICEPRQGCVLNGKEYKHRETNRDHCWILNCNNGTWERYYLNSECGECSVEGDPHIETFDKTNFLPEGDGRKYKFSGVKNFVIAQKGLGNSPLFGLNADFVPCNSQNVSNLSCVGSINYYEPGISIDVGLPVQMNITDPMDKLKIYFNGTEYEPTGISALEFHSVHRTVLVFKQEYDFEFTNTTCIYVVGSQDLSMSLCQDTGNFPHISVFPMPTLKGQLYGLCNTYTGTVQNSFTISSGARTQVTDFFADSWERTMLAK